MRLRLPSLAFIALLASGSVAMASDEAWVLWSSWWNPIRMDVESRYWANLGLCAHVMEGKLRDWQAFANQNRVEFGYPLRRVNIDRSNMTSGVGRVTP
jgi:hypothetical protein